MEYVYLGDRYTDEGLRKSLFAAVRRNNGKCIGGKNGNMLVQTQEGHKVVIVGRLLRKLRH